MQYQLIYRFRKTSIEHPAEINALEQALAESLGDSATLDGYDTGAREVNLFIMTAEPAAVFRRSKPVLERLALLDKVTAAYRLEGGVRFTVVWPLKYSRRFSLQ
jgi:hypothetical protein